MNALSPAMLIRPPVSVSAPEVGIEEREPRVASDVTTSLTGLLPRLRRFALSLTGSSADADELVQNACERALRHSDQLRDRTRADAWIYGIIRNLWVDELRGRRVRRHDDLDVAAEVAGEDGNATVEGRIGLAEVRRALARLPEEQRAVMVLICVDGLSYKEAAETMDLPIGTVMSRLSRGRAALHAALNERPGRGNVLPFVGGRTAGAAQKEAER